MNEVNICVTTKHLVATPLAPLSSTGPPRRRKWTQRVVVDVYGRNGEKSASMEKEEEMDLDYLSDIMSDSELEEDIFEPPQDPLTLQGAQSCAPPTTRPISIPSPLTLSPSCSSFVSPSPISSSIMRRFSPMGSWDAVTSPLSSGYGSAPRFFSSIGTQTPPTTPVLLETRIQLQLPETPSAPDSAEVNNLRLRQRLFQQDNSRTRFYSEGSGVDEGAGRRRGDRSLPDLVAGDGRGTFRSRTNSAPAATLVAMEAGRELRRISDEFESMWYPPRRERRRSFYDLLASLWPGENGEQPTRPTRAAERSQDRAASGGAA